MHFNSGLHRKTILPAFYLSEWSLYAQEKLKKIKVSSKIRNGIWLFTFPTLSAYSPQDYS